MISIRITIPGFAGASAYSLNLLAISIGTQQPPLYELEEKIIRLRENNIILVMHYHYHHICN